MLELRKNCEHCGKNLPNESSEAMICSFECTFCTDCVENVLHNVCPNCGGGLERRPTRPHKLLVKSPMRADRVFAPIEFNKFLIINKHIEPRKR
ncbi:MAG: DUF1272 domain-containing protein [Bacteroidales bacterium]